MGLFGLSYREWETLIRCGESEAAAHRKSMDNATTTFNMGQLKRIAKGSQFHDVRYTAENRLRELKSMTRKQRKAEEQAYKDQEEAKKNQAEQFRKAAEDKDRPEYWLKKLYEHYAIENSVGRQQIEEGLMAYGDAVYPHVRAYVFSLAQQFHEFTSGINEI